MSYVSDANQAFEPRWPVREGRERDLYFYLNPIESYLDHNRVKLVGHGEMIMLGSYSYLGLNGHPKIDQAARDAIDRYGTGTSGVRLLTGTLDLHHRLEERVARFKGAEAALTFSSGYLANLSTISCLVGRQDTIICDKRDHASIVDGCTLSTAKFVRYRHNDMEHLEFCLKKAAGRKLVIVDAVFSMDGDLVDLPGVSRLCREYDALLMVDEAHAIGVLGETGHGIEEHFGMPADSVDVKMGTFSKAIPSTGGYIAASHRLCEFVSHEARGFIYSGAVPPPAAAAAAAALDVIEEEPERVRRLHDNIAFFGDSLEEAALPVARHASAVFPIICGDDWQAWRLARHCQKNGVYAQAIPYPVVAKGTSRVRTMVSSAHRQKDLAYCVSVLREGAESIGGIFD